MDPSVDIVIANWNSGTQLSECLRSLELAATAGAHVQKVVVVDNASTDGSAPETVTLDLPLSVIHNDTNRGFGAACNQGAAVGTADYLLFLNPDTFLLADSLAKPLAFMSRTENAAVGITGIQLVNDRGDISRSCAYFPNLRRYLSHSLGLDRIFPHSFPGHFMTDWDHSSNRTVDHVMGAFFLVRRRLFETLGGFDERFFVYSEDLDFSLRARVAGWRSYYLCEARAYHRGGGTSDQIRAIRLFYSLRSQLLFARKHFTSGKATLLTLGVLLLEPFSRLALALFHLSGSEMKETVVGYSMLFRSLPSVLRS